MLTRAQHRGCFRKELTHRSDNQGIELNHDVLLLAFVWQLVEKVTNRIDARPLLVIALDDGPRGIGGVCVEEHRFLRVRIIIPFVERLLINGGELPLPEGIALAECKSALLFKLGDREVVLEESNAA